MKSKNQIIREQYLNTMTELVITAEIIENRHGKDSELYKKQINKLDKNKEIVKMILQT